MHSFFSSSFPDFFSFYFLAFIFYSLLAPTIFNFVNIMARISFLWRLPLRQVATMSSRCESVESVESVHLVREVLWDAMRTRHDWLGIFFLFFQNQCLLTICSLTSVTHVIKFILLLAI